MDNRILACALVIATAPVAAAAVPGPLTVSSYSTPNGSGSAAGSSRNFWDKNYSGMGNTMVDGALLSGGIGDLTDGIIAGGNWQAVENLAGTGPYVGWAGTVTANPLLTFSFALQSRVTGISIHVDNSAAGGVLAPGSIAINGVLTPFTAPAFGSIGFINFTGLNLVGNNVTLRFNHASSGALVMVSEVAFTGSVPEPTSWAMLITGFGLIGAAQRRRRHVAA